MSDHLLIFRDAPESADYPVQLLEGSIPSGLKGCLLRNGPGIQRVGNDAQHLLDGYGFIAGLYFNGDTPTFRARHVQTQIFGQERTAGRQLFRKPFTNLPRRFSNLFNVRLGNPAAHDVYAWGGKVYASDAPGHYALNAQTLQTEGPAPLNSLLGGTVQLAPMPRVDPHRGRLVAYSTRSGLMGADAITFHEYDVAWNEVHRQSASLPGKNLFLHDLAFTDNFYVVVEYGRLKVGTALVGSGPVIDSVTFDQSHPLRLFVVPRGRNGPLRQIPLPPGHQSFHLFNAFEREGQLIVDAVIYKGRVDFHDFYPPELKDRVSAPERVEGPFIIRHTFDLQTGGSQSLIIEGVSGEAPIINPARTGQQHRYGYVASPTSQGDEPTHEGYFWFHGLAKVDFDSGLHQTWSAGARAFCSPPAFVPRPDSVGEDDGWLLAWVMDAGTEKSQVVVLDAKTPALGPIARLGLKHLLPAASHTEFTQA
jgi:all-trans-8'-apo-beta-carotenal 15,15'-oxygenase